MNGALKLGSERSQAHCPRRLNLLLFLWRRLPRLPLHSQVRQSNASSILRQLKKQLSGGMQLLVMKYRRREGTLRELGDAPYKGSSEKVKWWMYIAGGVYACVCACVIGTNGVRILWCA
jgi:hypothetical protein